MKRLLSVLLILTLVLSFAPAVSLHAEATNSLELEEDIEVWLEDPVEEALSYMVIEGNAIITNCDSSLSGDIVIPDMLDGYPVTVIGSDSFESCNNLTSVVIPDSVTRIEVYAFSSCAALTSVTIGSGVTDIESAAFNSCNKLSDVTIGESVTTIGSDAFSCCMALTSIVIPDSVTSIGSYAFYGCTGLASVVIGKNVTAIGNYAFYDTVLTDVYYNGTQAQWNAISIDNENEALTNATIYYMAEPTEPEADSVITIQEAIALGISKDQNTYTTNKYYVTGVITEVYNTTYGNMKIKDAAGNILTIYGTYSADGTVRYDAMDVIPVAGDVVTVYGIIGQYNNVPQMKNGWITTHYVAEPEPTEPTEPIAPTEPTEPVEPAVGEIVVESKTAVKGKELTVSVEIKNNPGFAYLEVTPVIPDQFTLVQVENGELISDFTKGRQYIWVADEDITADGLLLTFTFLVDNHAEIGNYQIGFKVRTCANYAEQLWNLAVTGGEIAVIDTIYGDANDDGYIDGLDVLRLKKYLAEYDYETESSSVIVAAGADANGDGYVDGLDVLRLKKYFANYDYETGESTIVLGP